MTSKRPKPPRSVWVGLFVGGRGKLVPWTVEMKRTSVHDADDVGDQIHRYVLAPARTKRRKRKDKP